MGKMEGIISGFSRLEAVKRISLFIDEKKAGSSALIKGLFASSKGFFFCSAVKGCVSSHVHVIVEDSKEAAEYMCNDLYPEFGDNVFYFPSSSSYSSFSSSSGAPDISVVDSKKSEKSSSSSTSSDLI